MKKELRDMMKNQTIGIEIETNNITRKAAAMAAADFFGTGDYWYKGSCYDTWAARDAQGRVWQFERDSSIAGSEDQKCEIVSPILRYEDIDLLQDLVRVLRANGAKSTPRRGCGIHVHIGAAGHTPESLRNLVHLMAGHEELLKDSVGIATSRLDRWCRVVDRNFLRELDQKKPTTMSELSDIWYTSQGCSYGRSEHYNASRYHMLNLHATFTKGTIEFRLFQFDDYVPGKKGAGIHAGKIKAYIQLCLAMSNFAKLAKHVSSTAPTASTENPKYVFRFWMKAMGMVGDEFKTARDILLEKLEGNSDCRTGDRANCVHRAA